VGKDILFYNIWRHNLKKDIPPPGADPGFQVRRRAHLKKLRRVEGGANIFGVFRVKIHDFTPKKQNTESPSYL
jgi:transposase